MGQRAQDEVVVITGGSTGIGRGIAKKFLDEGAKVVIFGRSLASLTSAVEALSGDILAVQGDVSRTEDLEQLYTKTR